MIRLYTTLFLLTSVDGKISTGDTDIMDVDKDYSEIAGIKEGLKQYYDIQQQTDLCSLITGKVLEKIGINKKTDEPIKTPLTFIVVDNIPHLNEGGVVYLAKQLTRLIIVTNNKSHPAFLVKNDYLNIEVIFYNDKIDFNDLFEILRKDYGIERVTVQSGGTLNSLLIREGLIDRVLLVVAPALIGGSNTATLMDGDSLHTPSDIFKIKTLELIQAKSLEDSYLLLEYKVNN